MRAFGLETGLKEYIGPDVESRAHFEDSANILVNVLRLWKAKIERLTTANRPRRF